jgi:hypothetical protein
VVVGAPLALPIYHYYFSLDAKVEDEIADRLSSRPCREASEAAEDLARVADVPEGFAMHFLKCIGENYMIKEGVVRPDDNFKRDYSLDVAHLPPLLRRRSLRACVQSHFRQS